MRSSGFPTACLLLAALSHTFCSSGRVACPPGDLGCNPENTELLFAYEEVALIAGSDNTTASQAPAPAPPRRVFVTAVSYASNFGSPAAADALCMGDGNYPGSGTFKAMLADGVNRRACTSANCASGGWTEHIDWVLYPSTQYERPDGTVIMTTNGDGVFDFGGGNLTNSWGTTGSAWTGLDTDWTDHVDTCSGWTQNTSGNGARGSAIQVLANSLISSPFICTGGGQNFYCVEQ